jgi:serine phosphatase RsbU (regulator of sigma subunit)
VGINERARYQMGERRLAPGETVVMYTDGVTEAADRNGDLYSDQRFRELLNATDVSSAPQTVDVIQRDVRGFVQGAPPSDDLTLLVLRYRGG